MVQYLYELTIIILIMWMDYYLCEYKEKAWKKIQLPNHVKSVLHHVVYGYRVLYLRKHV